MLSLGSIAKFPAVQSIWVELLSNSSDGSVAVAAVKGLEHGLQGLLRGKCPPTVLAYGLTPGTVNAINLILCR